MATYTPQDLGYAGAAIVHSAVSASDNTPPGERLFLWVKNGGGVSTNVTVGVGGSTYGQLHADAVTAIPAGQERMFGPLLENLAAADTFNLVVFSYSATASVTAALVQLPAPSESLPI